MTRFDFQSRVHQANPQPIYMQLARLARREVLSGSYRPGDEFGGFGGMLAFAVRGDADAQNRFVAALRIVTSAVSLGHDESLIVHVAAAEKRSRFYPEQFRRWGHLRSSVGIEDPRDLVADLDQALTAVLGPAAGDHPARSPAAGR